jgi:hypothetical protein
MLSLAISDLGDAYAGHGGRVAAQIFDVRVHVWPGGSDHAVPAILVAIDPVLPTEWCQPKPVDQDDGSVGGGRVGRIGDYEVILMIRSRRAGVDCVSLSEECQQVGVELVLVSARPWGAPS